MKMVLDSCGAMMRFFSPWQTLRDQIFSSLINESKTIKEKQNSNKTMHKGLKKFPSRIRADYLIPFVTYYTGNWITNKSKYIQDRYLVLGIMCVIS